jgi:hypothetical protein
LFKSKLKIQKKNSILLYKIQKYKIVPAGYVPIVVGIGFSVSVNWDFNCVIDAKAELKFDLPRTLSGTIE